MTTVTTMRVHGVVASGRATQCVARNPAMRAPQPVLLNMAERVLKPRVSLIVRADKGNGSDTATSSLMPMADSLIERAKEVAASGVVDDDFKTVYVTELEAELQALTRRCHDAEASASAIEESVKSAKDQFLRLSADFDNFRKRTANEKDALKANAKADVVTALLTVIDNFELAKGQLKPQGEGELKIDAAYQGLYKQLVEAFRGMGLETVPGAGSMFDPELHEAIMREANDDVPEGTVLEEFRRGFKLGDRLLRPAMVKVSYSDAPAPGAAAAESEESGEGESEESA